MQYFRQIKSRSLLNGLALLFVVTGCRAASLVDLLPRADAVVVGTASGRADSGQLIAFKLAVEQSLKGDVKPGAVLDLRWRSWAPANQSYGTQSWRGIWFLTRAGEGAFDIQPVRMGAKAFFEELFYRLPAHPGPAPVSAGPNATIEDSIITQLAGTAADDGNEQVLEAAALLDSDKIRESFRYLARQTAIRPMCVGLAGLIARNDVTALARVEAALPSAGEPESDIVATAIRVWFRNPDDGAAAMLARLTKFGRGNISEAALSALVALHTRAAVPFLAGLLDDPDARRQQAAVAGLAAFANGLPIQRLTSAPGPPAMPAAGSSPYRTQDTEKHTGAVGALQDVASADDIAFWKTWWTLHRAELEK